MRKFIPRLASAFAALAISLSLASCSGNDDPGPDHSPVAVTGVTLSQATMDLVVGTAGNLTAAVQPSGASQAVAWDSSNPTVASVTGTGATVAINPLASGTATITVASAAATAKTASCVVTVTPAVEGVTLAPTELTLKPGDAETLVATVLPADALDKSVAWSSSAPDVATVENGLVTAVTEGLATITATTLSGGFKATCAVAVENAAQQVLTTVAGMEHTMAIKTDGGLWSWGDNGYQELGDGTWADRPSPAQVGAASGWKSVACGLGYTQAIRDDGTLWAWGLNSQGRLGLGYVSWYEPTITQVGTDSDWAIASAGRYHTLAIKEDGSLWAWGSNDYGALGLGDSGYETYRDVPTRVGTDKDWKLVAAGNEFSMAIKNDGSLWGWGVWWVGQFGVPWTGSEANPNPIQVGTDKDWAVVACGEVHSAGIKADGSLWTWGSNEWSQLGGNTSEDWVEIPTRVGAEKDWKTVAASYDHSVALKTDGSIWAWGQNGRGQIGNGTTVTQIDPVRIGQANDWAVALVGDENSMALKVDGSLYTWGWNKFGQLGVGDFTNRDAPTLVGGGWRVPAR